MDNQEIILKLTLEETNLILKALGERPFKEVYELIGQINAQAVKQTQGMQDLAHQLSTQSK